MKAEEMADQRLLLTRADITPGSFTNWYNWGISRATWMIKGCGKEDW